MTYQVRSERQASNELATIWLQAGSELRRGITLAVHKIDELLKTDPYKGSESRAGTRRIMVVAPPTVLFQAQEDDRAASVIEIRLFHRKGL